MTTKEDESRTERLIEIFINLVNGKSFTKEQIATDYGISERMVYRDIKLLRYYDVPIITDEEKGYLIEAKCYCQPLKISESDINALSFSYALIKNFTDNAIRQDFEKSVNKFINFSSDTFPAQIMDCVELNTLKFESYKEHLSIIMKAICENTIIRITHISYYDQIKTEREIEPLKLRYFKNSWHILAFCHLRNDFREFSIKGITELDMTKTKFRHSKKNSIDEYLAKMENDTYHKKVVIMIPDRILHIAEYEIYKYNILSQEKANEQTVVTLYCNDFEEFSRTILGFYDDVEIIEPNELKEICRLRIEKIQKKNISVLTSMCQLVV